MSALNEYKGLCDDEYTQTQKSSIPEPQSSQRKQPKKSSNRDRGDNNRTKSKSSRRLPVKRQGIKSVRCMADAIRRSLQKTQDDFDFGSNSNEKRGGNNGSYAIALPSGMIRDVRGSVLATLLAMSVTELAAHMMEEDSKWKVVKRNMHSLVQKASQENNTSNHHRRASGAESPMEVNSSQGGVNSGVPMVEAKTEDGRIRLVPRHEKGKIVWYKSPQGIVEALILESHLDDLHEPYYTIRLMDGREKQTDNAHILLLPDGSKPAVHEVVAPDSNTRAIVVKEDPPEEGAIVERNFSDNIANMKSSKKSTKTSHDRKDAKSTKFSASKPSSSKKKKSTDTNNSRRSERDSSSRASTTKRKLGHSSSMEAAASSLEMAQREVKKGHHHHRRPTNNGSRSDNHEVSSKRNGKDTAGKERTRSAARGMMSFFSKRKLRE